MKKLLLFVLAAVTVTACNKGTDDPIDGDGSTSKITAPPASFTTRALVEKMTGEWCQYCPNGVISMKGAVDAGNSGVVAGKHMIEGIAWHTGDNITSGAEDVVINGVFKKSTGAQETGVPSGLVQRSGGTKGAGGAGSWSGAAYAATVDPVNCGLAIDAQYEGTKATIEVQCAFSEKMDGDYDLVVVLTEDNVKGYQINAYAGDANHAFGSYPQRIDPYYHEHVARKALTNPLGEAIPSEYNVKGGVYKKTFTTDLLTAGFVAMDPAHTRVVAFICKRGTTWNTKGVVNVIGANMGTTTNWNF